MIGIDNLVQLRIVALVIEFELENLGEPGACFHCNIKGLRILDNVLLIHPNRVIGDVDFVVEFRGSQKRLTTQLGVRCFSRNPFVLGSGPLCLPILAIDVCELLGCLCV